MDPLDYLEFFFNCVQKDDFIVNLDLKLTRKMEKAICAIIKDILT